MRSMVEGPSLGHRPIDPSVSPPGRHLPVPARISGRRAVQMIRHAISLRLAMRRDWIMAARFRFWRNSESSATARAR
jgi:hypothetical protein